MHRLRTAIPITTPLRQSRVSPRPRPSRNGNRPALIRGLRRTRFSPNVADTSSQLVDGVNAMATVSSYVNAMISSNLPTFENAPSWWIGFTTNFMAAKTSAMEWVNTIAEDFTYIPEGIVNYNNLFQQNVGTIQGYCTLLEGGTGTSGDESSVTSTLQQLVTQLNDNQSSAQSFSTELAAFATSLNTANANMSSALQEALQTDGSDQAQVNALQAQINALNADIAACNEALTIIYIGVAITIFITLIGIALAIITGGATGVFMIVAGVIGITTTATALVLNNQAIQADAATVQSDTGQMTALNQQILSLNILQTMLTNLIALANDAQQAIQAITTAWGTLSSDITTVVGDLTNASTDNTNQNWSELSDDIGTALTDWTTLDTYAQDIQNLTFNISSTVSNIGSSSN